MIQGGRVVAGPPVVVVGAGPVGLTMALLLARHGLGVLVLERHQRPYPLPRAVHLDDEVARILQAAGVAEDFLRVARPGAGLRVLDARHRVLATFVRDARTGAAGYPQALMFDQPDLERLLRAAVAAESLIELRAGCEVTGLRMLGPDAVSVGTAAGPVPACAVVGCDGAQSTVRRVIGSRPIDLGGRADWLVVDVRTDVALAGWDGVDQVADPRRPATFMRVGADRYRFEFRLDPGESEQALAAPDSLARLVAPWLVDPADAARLDVHRAARYSYAARSVDRWRAGRVLLAGDAAHQMPPFIGQGLGAGLRDAYNLAWKLAAVLTGAAPDSLLDTYQGERERHVRGQIRLARLLGAVMTRGGSTAGLLRRGVLAGLQVTPGVRSVVLDSVTPRLRIAGAPWWRTRLVGRMCPQPWVRCGNERQRLDDVLGRGWAVLAVGPVTPTVRALAHRHGAVLVVVLAAGERGGPDLQEVTEIDGQPSVRHWLAAGEARAVLLRPDRVVAAVPARGGSHGPGG